MKKGVPILETSNKKYMKQRELREQIEQLAAELTLAQTSDDALKQVEIVAKLAGLAIKLAETI